MATIHIQLGGIAVPMITKVNQGEEVKFEKDFDGPVSIHFQKHDGCFSKLPQNDFGLPNMNPYSIGDVTNAGDNDQPFIVSPPGGQESPAKIIRIS
ncbi:MAG: hypothetical protein R3321_04415 [Nitrososphaeraceae archaeon]|nr:hypothetical protein [Nitrososphaeraceae archaeon]